MKKVPEIKILSNGFNRFQTQCTKCGCEYEYDIKNVDFGKRKREHGFVRCPVCGCWHEHKLNENVRKVDVLAKYNISQDNQLNRIQNYRLCKYRYQSTRHHF